MLIWWVEKGSRYQWIYIYTEKRWRQYRIVNMASFYENNCSAHWSYSPYSYGHSFETSSSTSSSFVESPMASSSPRAMMMMMPIYDQQPAPHCYYYSEPPTYHHSYTPSPPPSTYIATPMPCVTSPSTVVRPSTNLPNRLQYTGRQRWLLNEIYQHVPYPNSVQKNVIADRVGATREQIRKYFPSELHH